MAAIFNHRLDSDWNLFGTLGAFPVEYTSDTASSNGFDKEESDTKWLFGGQIGADWKINRSNKLKLAGAYYQFQNIEGERSSLCKPWEGKPGCDTDGSRVAIETPRPAKPSALDTLDTPSTGISLCLDTTTAYSRRLHSLPGSKSNLFLPSLQCFDVSEIHVSARLT